MPRSRSFLAKLSPVEVFKHHSPAARGTACTTCSSPVTGPTREHATASAALSARPELLTIRMMLRHVRTCALVHPQCEFLRSSLTPSAAQPRPPTDTPHSSVHKKVRYIINMRTKILFHIEKSHACMACASSSARHAALYREGTVQVACKGRGSNGNPPAHRCGSRCGGV